MGWNVSVSRLTVGLLSCAPRWVPSTGWLISYIIWQFIGVSRVYRALCGMESPVINSYFKAFDRHPSLLCCECMFATSG